MDKDTKQRLSEIREIIKKHGFDKILGQAAKDRIKGDSDDSQLILDNEIPEKLRLMLQDLGTTFIKFGQLLSTRPDMVGERISTELSKLQDDNPDIGYDSVKRIVERELGGKIEDLFDDFSKQPLATASIGQVHEARLLTGERVAIKVQKDGIADKIDLDIRIMKYIAEKADRYNSKLKKINLPGIMEEFDRSIHKEIDYNNELMNMKRIEANFEFDETIHIPISYSDYCTSKILTMEFIDGMKLAEVYESDSEEFDKPLLANRILESYLKQIFIDGFFHGDPHPGNLIILPDNVVCYIDLGMMGRLDEEFQRNLSELMILFMDQDIDGLINQLMYMDILDYDIDTRPLKRDMSDLFARYFGVELNRFNGVLEELLNLMQEYGVILPNEFVTMARGLSMIESIAQNLDPEIDVFACLEPVARQILRHRLDPKKYLKSQKSDLILFGHMFKSIPSLLSRTIHKMEDGELKFKFEVDRLYNITNKVAITLILAALLISSSILMSITSGPMIHVTPYIGLAGYIATFVIGIGAILKFVIKR